MNHSFANVFYETHYFYPFGLLDIRDFLNFFFFFTESHLFHTCYVCTVTQTHTKYVLFLVLKFCSNTCTTLENSSSEHVTWFFWGGLKIREQGISLETSQHSRHKALFQLTFLPLNRPQGGLVPLRKLFNETICHCRRHLF